MIFLNNYYVGLDIGTDSIGWAVTHENYQLVKFKGNAMWGVRLFDESKTAQERRVYRASRRRTFRRHERIEWLQMLFNTEIAKKDVAFFQRLKESNLYLEDKSTDAPYAVFADDDYNDKQFHEDYKTIFHLRKELIENKAPHDIRLVYLALHHIIKNRGHFLFDNLGDDFNSVQSFDKLLYAFVTFLSEEYELELECTDAEKVGDILKNKSLSKTAKSSQIATLCGITPKKNIQQMAIIKLICGQKVKLSDIYNDKALDEDENSKIDFSSGFDDNEDAYHTLLVDRYELIEKAKAIYDWALLADILKNESYISVAKVKSYEEHQTDLKTLKSYVKTHCKVKYFRIFRESKKGLNNYTAYSGKYKENGKNGVLQQKAKQEDFCKFLKNELKPYVTDKPEYAEMFSKIDNGNFMPKQIIKDNGVIPMQLHRDELKQILNNACEYLEFLNETDTDGITVKDKIIKIFEYRIPYYVGPLNIHSDKHWLVRSNEKIYPWNFSKVVDIEKSAEAFIQNLTSKCTYLPTKDVIPKNSILYSRFTVLNELNNLCVNGEKVDVELKQSIFNSLFLVRKRVTQKAVKEHIASLTNEKNIELTGIDGDFKSNMRSYIELKPFNLTEEEMEAVISAITIFGDDKKLLRKRLRNQLGSHIDDEAIHKISRLKYSDWGSLSRELLTEIYDFSSETGEITSNIIDTLWNTNDNLMILLGSKYNFGKAIQQAVLGYKRQGTLKEMVEDLYVSPKVKRPIYQSLKIVEEITKIMGHAPAKIFIETTRRDEKKGDAGRKASRKTKLLELYSKCKKECEELYKEIYDTPDEHFKRDKLYLYYTQMGRCMYTGEPINLSDLFNNNLYDIDHIFPRSKVKDDSLDNRVLVKKQVNADKDNNYPLNAEIRSRMKSHWKFLKEKELISKKKYQRLTRVTPLTDDELSDFIARQIVETSQSTKAVAEILGVLYPRPRTEIVYVKASLVSEFRHSYDLLKCREVNDLHHAKDAYLNIVVGNVYNERCTHNKSIFIKGLQTKKYSLNKMFTFNTKNAWIADNDTSIRLVKRTMSKNNILFTRHSYIKHGELFKINPLKKGSGQAPLKHNSPLSDISKYGGYDKPTAAYFAFVEHTNQKGKKVRQLVAIDSYMLNTYESNPEKYLTSVLGLNEVKVLIRCVKKRACIEIDGFRMHLGSKSNGGKTLEYYPAIQLVTGYKYESYIKKLLKLLTKPDDYEVISFDEVSSEENIGIYDTLVHKMTNTVYKTKYAKLGQKLLDSRDIFASLDIKKQCYIISELLKIMHANSRKGDLQLINESKNSGTLTTNSTLSEIGNVKSIKLINQSITGLYENEIDLLNM